MSECRPNVPGLHFITVEEFAQLARVSRRTIDRYRQARPTGFPTEFDMGRGKIPRPRFKLKEVQQWLDSRALW
jgi:predicted DNA-binding transcriptional regulator AlpA